MIWALLALFGVPLWLIAIALGLLVFRNRSLRARAGNIPCRVQLRPGARWTRGHGLWVHDVFSFRASPAAWNEWLGRVRQASLRPPDSEEAGRLKRLSDPIIATFLLDDGSMISAATAGEHQSELTGPITPMASLD